MAAKNKMFSLRIPHTLLEEYRKFCEENSINISKRLRKFMERDLETWRAKKNSQFLKNLIFLILEYSLEDKLNIVELTFKE